MQQAVIALAPDAAWPSNITCLLIHRVFIGVSDVIPLLYEINEIDEINRLFIMSTPTTRLVFLASRLALSMSWPDHPPRVPPTPLEAAPR